MNNVTQTEKRKNNKMQALPADIGIDLSNASADIMAALEIVSNNANRDEVLIGLLIRAARLMPNYIPELQKYL